MNMKKMISTLLVLALFFTTIPDVVTPMVKSEAKGVTPSTVTENTQIKIKKSAASGAAAEGETADKKIVCIDPGHQTHANLALEPIGPGASTKKYKVTGGATGCVTGVPEYKLALKMGKKLRKELKARGYKVIMTRTTNDVNLSNSERAEIANNAKADAFIRIHANSSDSGSVAGALTLGPSSDNPYMTAKNIKKSRRFSRKMINAFCAATGATNRGVMYTNTMSGINWCKVPVTIIEMGFMSNPTEDRLMQDKDYQEKMVQGMADGIDAFLK